MKLLNHISVAVFAVLTFATTGYAQKESSKLNLNIDFGAYKLNSAEGVNPFITTGNTLSLNPQIGIDYFSNSVFFSGLGLSYHFLSDEQNQKMIIDSFYSEIHTKRKISAFAPNISIGAKIPLRKQVFFYNRLRVSYGFASQDTEYSYAGYNFTNISGAFTLSNISDPPVSYEHTAENSWQYISVAYIPELLWYFNEKTALRLSCGAAEYAKINEADKGEWAFSFNPRFWNLGVSIGF